MRMYDIIQKKRDRGTLTEKEISFFLDGCVSGKIPDEQTAALLMAIFLNGMTARETELLTIGMARSGTMLDLSGFANTVDKHSTGGVGDKTTLVAAPLAAACGCIVAKMSGRGLGHTGGTIDKLESVPGLKTALSQEAFETQLHKIGLAIVSQTGNLTPADKKLYALRDITATVESLPLIASSIMSKKLAAGATSIVLDVKTGNGALLKTQEQGRLLAQEMLRLGSACGRNMAVILTDMNRPLGFAIGNALEVQEAIETLQGRGPQDLTELSITLAAAMLSLAKQLPETVAQEQVRNALSTRHGLKKLKEMIGAQGGNCQWVDHPEQIPTATVQRKIFASKEGFLSEMDTEALGQSALLLGAGRNRKEDTIDPLAGIRLFKKTGDAVCRGDILAVFYSSDFAKTEEAEKVFSSAIRYAATPPPAQPLILQTMFQHNQQ